MTLKMSRCAGFAACLTSLLLMQPIAAHSVRRGASTRFINNNATKERMPLNSAPKLNMLEGWLGKDVSRGLDSSGSFYRVYAATAPSQVVTYTFMGMTFSGTVHPKHMFVHWEIDDSAPTEQYTIVLSSASPLTHDIPSNKLSGSWYIDQDYARDNLLAGTYNILLAKKGDSSVVYTQTSSLRPSEQLHVLSCDRGGEVCLLGLCNNCGCGVHNPGGGMDPICQPYQFWDGVSATSSAPAPEVPEALGTTTKKMGRESLITGCVVIGSVLVVCLIVVVCCGKKNQWSWWKKVCGRRNGQEEEEENGTTGDNKDSENSDNNTGSDVEDASSHNNEKNENDSGADAKDAEQHADPSAIHNV